MRSRVGWLLAAVAALMVAWLVTPAAVLLYDGVGFPDEPYRYVDPPPGYRKTPLPTKAFGAVAAERSADHVSRGTSGRAPDGAGASAQDLYSKSAEQMAQVEIYVAKGGLTGPATARSFHVSAVPLAAGRSAAAAPRIDGDIYRVSMGCSSVPPGSAGPVGAAAACPATLVPRGARRSAWIAMRATSARRPAPVFLYRPAPAAAWRTLPTDRAGNDIYATALRGPGEYALTFEAGPRSADNARSGRATTASAAPAIVVLVIMVIVLTATVGAIRFARTDRRRQ